MNWSFVLLATVTCAFPSLSAFGGPGPSREDVSARLRHYEGLMQSLECEYKHRVLPTTPAQAALFRRVHGKDGENFVLTEKNCQARGGDARFWRKGVKQRVEWTSLA